MLQVTSVDTCNGTHRSNSDLICNQVIAHERLARRPAVASNSLDEQAEESSPEDGPEWPHFSQLQPCCENLPLIRHVHYGLETGSLRDEKLKRRGRKAVAPEIKHGPCKAH